MILIQFLLFVFLFQHKPVKSVAKVTFKSGPRRTLKKLKNVMRSGNRRDLTQVALRRASALLRSQKPQKAKKATKTAAKAKAE